MVSLPFLVFPPPPNPAELHSPPCRLGPTSKRTPQRAGSRCARIVHPAVLHIDGPNHLGIVDRFPIEGYLRTAHDSVGCLPGDTIGLHGCSRLGPVTLKAYATMPSLTIRCLFSLPFLDLPRNFSLPFLDHPLPFSLPSHRLWALPHRYREGDPTNSCLVRRCPCHGVCFACSTAFAAKTVPLPCGPPQLEVASIAASWQPVRPGAWWRGAGWPQSAELTVPADWTSGEPFFAAFR